MKMLHEYIEDFYRTHDLDGNPLPVHKEGELYKVITAYGKTFEILYGYYDEKDRQNPEIEPYEIYPDFELNPEYTDDGIPFTVAWQAPCKHYRLAEGCKKHEDNGCYECKYYEKCDELLGVCRCKARKKIATD